MVSEANVQPTVPQSLPNRKIKLSSKHQINLSTNELSLKENVFKPKHL